MENIAVIIEKIQKICPPETKVEILPTNQSGEIYLIVLQFPHTYMADVVANLSVKSLGYRKIERFQAVFKKDPFLKRAYYWGEQKINHLHYDEILPLFEDQKHFRILYFCDGKFVFYPLNFGCLKGGSKLFSYVGMNDKMYYKYVGSCRSIKMVVDILTTTADPL